MQQITLPLSLSAPQNAWRPDAELPELTNVLDLAMDTETTGVRVFTDKPVGLSIAYRAPELRTFYFPFNHSEGNIDEEKLRRWCLTELIGKKIWFCNAKFDLHVINNWLGISLEDLGVQPQDISFNGALLDDNRRSGFGLNDLALKYVGEEKMKVQGGLGKLNEVPSWLVAEYAKQDASLTYRVAENTLPLIKQQDLENVLELENDLIYCICEIERNGCRFDVPKLEAWIEEIQRKLDWTLLEIYKVYGMRVNPNSGEDLNKLFKKLDIPSPGYRAKAKEGRKAGWAGFSDERLQPIQHPVMELILFARHADSLLSKFLLKYQKALDGDVARFQLHQLKGDDEFGTVSGRMSSSGGGSGNNGYDFNVQQVIKTEKQIEELGNQWLVRELFIPDDGYKFMACDAAQIEYRLTAHYAQNQKVLDAYNASPPYEFIEIDGKPVYITGPDADYHAVVMQLLKPIVPGWKDKKAKEIRKPTKNVNFARLYGGGPPKIAYMLGLDGMTSVVRMDWKEYEERLPETMSFLKIYDQILPEAKTLMEVTSNLARTRGWVKTMLGRRARFEPDDRHYSALNRVVQGSAADAFKVTLRALYEERHNLGIHKLRQPVHDEQCADIDPDPIYELKLQEFFNEQRIELRVPLLWDLKTGANWKECG